MKKKFAEVCIFSNICRIYMKIWLWEKSNSEVFDLFIVKLKRSQILSFWTNFPSTEILSNFKKLSKIWNWPQKTLFSEVCRLSNICQIHMKSWLWERSNSEVSDLFSVKLERSQFLSFWTTFLSTEIFSNFKKLSKIWNWRQKNFIFRGLYIFEYLSDRHEKLTGRKVKF